MPRDAQSGVYFECHGDGPALLLGPVLLATQRHILGPQAGDALDRYRELLARQFRVVTVDYPGIGESADLDPGDLTPARASADLLSVMTAAGTDRFAYWGYSWGGAVGLDIARRTDRLTALVIGGWSPAASPAPLLLAAAQASLADPPASSLAVLRSKGQYRQWITYFEALLAESPAPSEATELPRLVYVGEHADAGAGDAIVPIATAVQRGRVELEACGWRVDVIPGLDHGGTLFTPDEVVPRIAPWLHAAIEGARL